MTPDATRRPRIIRANLQLVLLVVLVLGGLGFLVGIVSQVPTQRANQAMENFAAVQVQMQRLDAAVRSMRAQYLGYRATGQTTYLADFAKAAVEARVQLNLLAKARCGPADGPSIDAQSLGDLAGVVIGWEASMGAQSVQGPDAGETPRLPSFEELMDDFHTHLLALDRSVQACWRLEINDVVFQADLTRNRMFVLLAAVGAAVLAILSLLRGERRRIRDQLRFNEQLIDAIPLPLSLRSPDGLFVLVNRAWERRHNLKRQTVVGDRMLHYFSQQTVALIEQLDADAAATQHSVEREHAVIGRKRRYDVVLRLQALRQLNQQLIGTILIETDISALRRKETELTGMNERLKQLSVQMMDAQEDERRRIARDLHDQVGQILTALKLQLASLAKRDRIDSPPTAFATPIDLTEEALRHTRDLTSSLHPHLLDDLGIEPALNWLIERFIRASVPDIELRCRLQPPRSNEVAELAAFRVVQEALTNVVRHAKATRVGVMLEAQDGWLRIEVIDDGVGFEPGDSSFDPRRPGSLGMTSMRDRVTELGGEFSIDSDPGAGTSVRARLPW